MANKFQEQNKNNILDNLFIIILCAGKGTRFGNVTKTIPKPLIKVKNLENKPILFYILKSLAKTQVKNLVVITGYLGHKIEALISSLSKLSMLEHLNIQVINSDEQYKLGPLYSFLSIQKNNEIYKENKIYLVIPGDTMFQTSYFQRLIDFIKKKYKIINKYPVVFYRKISLKSLEKELGFDAQKLISTISLKSSQNQFLEEIIMKKFIEYDEGTKINQIYPSFLLPHQFVKKITEIKQNFDGNSIKQVINYLSRLGFMVYAKSFHLKYHFYDIDDVKTLEKVKSEKLKY
jgi:NDP-sugar pyrophosphorylase family protein